MNSNTLQDFLPLVLFLAVALVIACAAVGLSWLIAKRKPDAAKNAAYECGFDPLCVMRAKCDIRFYLVALLFILFDVEVAFLFPWAVALEEIGVAGFVAMLVFLGILTVGFVYEWRKGALEWE